MRLSHAPDASFRRLCKATQTPTSGGQEKSRASGPFQALYTGPQGRALVKVLMLHLQQRAQSQCLPGNMRGLAGTDEKAILQLHHGLSTMKSWCEA